MSRSGLLPAKVLIGGDPDGFVHAAAWAQALAKNTVIGMCRCGQPTRPGQPIHDPKHGSGIVWYPAECPAGHTRLASGARPTRENNGRTSP